MLSKIRKIKMSCYRALAITAFLAMISHPLSALASHAGASAKLSTLGVGLEVDYAFSDQFSIRGQMNSLSIDRDFEENGIEYTSELGLSTIGGLLDWRPFSGLFRMTAGGFSNNNKLTGFSKNLGTYEIGDRIYEFGAGNNARVDATIQLGDGFTPYLGFGWGSNAFDTRGLSYSFDIGVLFQGTPTVELNAEGTATDQQTGFVVDLATNPIVQSELKKEEKNLESDLNEYDLYPVISFGLGYLF